MAINATTAEDRLTELGVHLPAAPTPFGAYVPAVQTGNLLFLSGMLATSGHTATAVGVVGKDLDVRAGREAAYKAALNVLALTRKQLGSLNRVSRVVRLGVYVAATPEFTEHPKVADAASELLALSSSGRVINGLSLLGRCQRAQSGAAPAYFHFSYSQLKPLGVPLKMHQPSRSA